MRTSPHLSNVLAAMLVLWVGLATSGCGTVGITPHMSPLSGYPFDQALMAYARGDLDYARTRLREASEHQPHDRRVQILRDAIMREQGEASVETDNLWNEVTLQAVTPEELRRHVLGHSPEILQALHRVIAARGQLREQHLSMTPEFSILTRFYPAGLFAALTQSLVDGLVTRNARITQAEEQLIASIAQYAQVRDDVLRRALHEYLNVYRARTLADLQTHAIRVGEERERIARVLTTYGVFTPAQSANVVTASDELRSELQLYEHGETLPRYALNTLMDRVEHRTFEISPKVLVVDEPRAIQTLVGQAHRRHPSVLQAHAAIEEQRARKTESLWSTSAINLRATHGLSDQTDNAGFFLGPTVGGRITAPLLLWPITEAKSAQEDAFISALEMELKHIRAQHTVAVVQAHRTLEAAQRALRTIRAQRRNRDEEARVVRYQKETDRRQSNLAALDADLAYLNTVKQEFEQDIAVQRAALDLHHASGAPMNDLVFTDPQPFASLRRFRGPSTARPRALWVDRLESVTRNTEFFLEFAKAQKIQTIVLTISTSSLTEQGAALSEIITHLHTHDITVHGFIRVPHWILPAHTPDAQSFYEALVTYQATEPTTAQFDGLHVDAAPHTLPAWTSDEHEPLIQQFVEFVDWSHVYARKADIPLAVDIPDWYVNLMYQDMSVPVYLRTRVDLLVVTLFEPLSPTVFSILRREPEYPGTPLAQIWIGVHADSTAVRHLQPSSARITSPTLDDIVSTVESDIPADLTVVGVAINSFERVQRLVLLPPLTATDLMPIYFTDTR